MKEIIIGILDVITIITTLALCKAGNETDKKFNR